MQTSNTHIISRSATGELTRTRAEGASKSKESEPVTTGSIPAAYFHFIHAFGNGRLSYASEPIAKRTVRSARDTTWTLCNHVMQSCRIAYSLLGELRQHFADYKYLR